MMEFYEKLQALRKQSGLTQEELAQVLYVSRTAISKWESGRGYPNIESLKAIAAYFSVTVDALLSGEQVLSIAEKEQQQKRAQLCDLILGLLNSSVALLLVLPCFRQTVDGDVQAVSLLCLIAVNSYTYVFYWIAIGLCVGVGALMLFMQKCHSHWWMRAKHILSLAVVSLGVLLFILGTQPYAAVLLFSFLTIQVLLLLKK